MERNSKSRTFEECVLFLPPRDVIRIPWRHLVVNECGEMCPPIAKGTMDRQARMGFVSHKSADP